MQREDMGSRYALVAFDLHANVVELCDLLYGEVVFDGACSIPYEVVYGRETDEEVVHGPLQTADTISSSTIGGLLFAPRPRCLARSIRIHT